MKTLNLILAAILISVTSIAQTPIKLVKERVGNDDLLKNWKIDEVKAVNNVKVKRIAGENDVNHRTNVFYVPKSQLMGEAYQKAETEPIYQKELEELKEFYTTKAAGGQVKLFYDRHTEKLANPGSFTVVIRDADTEDVIYETQLEYQRPYYYKWGIYYCFKTINIPVETGEKFIIQVKDEGLQQSFEFLVYDNFEEAQPEEPAIYSVGKK